MTQPLVAAENLARDFGSGDGKVAALQPTTFSIRAGDRIALLGPSGSGKSTLLNLICGLDEPSGGRIAWPAIGSHDSLRPLAVGMIHQFAALVPTLTVAENVALPLRLGHRLGQGKAVTDALAAVDLVDFADRLPDELSGGQAQRAGIARVLAHQPILLLADEPTGQLDRATGQAALSAILDHAGHEDAAIVVATHDPVVAERMDRIWRMEFGGLITGTDGPGR